MECKIQFDAVSSEAKNPSATLPRFLLQSQQHVRKENQSNLGDFARTNRNKRQLHSTFIDGIITESWRSSEKRLSFVIQMASEQMFLPQKFNIYLLDDQPEGRSISHTLSRPNEFYRSSCIAKCNAVPSSTHCESSRHAHVCLKSNQCDMQLCQTTNSGSSTRRRTCQACLNCLKFWNNSIFPSRKLDFGKSLLSAILVL